MLTNRDNKRLNFKSVAFYGTVIISLVVIGYFLLLSNKDSKDESIETASSTTLENTQPVGQQEPTPLEDTSADNTTSQDMTEKEISLKASPEPSMIPTQQKQTQSTPVQGNDKNNTNSAKPTEATSQKQMENTPAKPVPTPNSTSKPASNVKPAANPDKNPDNTAIRITKSEVTGSASFYPYQLDGLAMEVIAVKATDGTIRTALNTCQVCYDSGKGYYEQVGEFLVCQNCGNRFHIDQIEKVKGGCNPVPIMQENKQDTGDVILISKDFLAKHKEYFSKWKKE